MLLRNLLIVVLLWFLSITLIPLKAVSIEPSVESASKIMEIAVKRLHLHSTSNQTLPYATIAYAQTIDGSIAPITKTRLSLSSKSSFKLLHSLRKHHDAVLVGINTIVTDNPQLNVREVLPGVDIPTLSSQPRSIILDSKLSFLDLPTLKVHKPIIVTVLSPNDSKFIRALNKLQDMQGNILTVRESEDGSCDIVDAFQKLKSFGISSILVEGGARILQSVLENNLCNQVMVTIRPCFLGGYRSMTTQLSTMVQLENISLATVQGDIVIIGETIRMTPASTENCQQENNANVCDIDDVFIRSTVNIV